MLEFYFFLQSFIKLENTKLNKNKKLEIQIKLAKYKSNRKFKNYKIKI